MDKFCVFNNNESTLVFPYVSSYVFLYDRDDCIMGKTLNIYKRTVLYALFPCCFISEWVLTNYQLEENADFDFVLLSLRQSWFPCFLPWTPRTIVYSSQFCLNVLPGSFLDSTSPLLAIAACTALGEIGRNGPLPIPSEGSGFTKLHLVESLLNRIPSSKETNKASLSFFPLLLEFFLFTDM